MRYFKAIIKAGKKVWIRSKTQNIDVIIEIWSNKSSSDKPPKYSILEKGIYTIILSLRALSLSNFIAIFHDEASSLYSYIDLYLLSWALTLFFILQICSHITILAIIIACYRVTDILSYQLSILLIDRKIYSPYRSFIAVLINIFEIVLAFAIIYLTTGSIIENTEKGQIITNSIVAFYYSLITFATLGYGEFIPKDNLARFIVITQLLSELLLLLTIVPTLISNFKLDTKND